MRKNLGYRHQEEGEGGGGAPVPHLKTRKQSSMETCHKRTDLSMEAVSTK